MVSAKLYETKHPYYCTEGCYFSNECHINVPSWAAFKGTGVRDIDLGAFFGADEDLNLLYRFDWDEPDPSDYAEDEDFDPSPTLKLYYMLQRKARPMSLHVKVTREEEPEIRAWLAKKWQHMQRLWTPFAPDIEADADDEARIERTLLHYGGAEPLEARS